MFELMTKGVRTVKPTMPAEEAWAVMRRAGIHHLVVVRESQIVGILSDRDIGGRAGAAVRAGRTVADLMTTAVVTRAPTDTVRSAANVMRGRSIGCLPIVEGGRPVGMVTVSDLLNVLARGGDRRVSGERAVLNWKVPHRRRRSAW